MTARIPESHQDLLSEEVRAFGVLATTMPDGSPQATPVWVDREGEFVLVNTARDRIKDKNMQARPHVALTILDPDDPYRYMQIRGEVVENIEEGAVEHINRLSAKYTGNPKYPVAEGDVRVIYTIRPTSVFAK
jgi:PPOX class probable F420-dependent enzyme